MTSLTKYQGEKIPPFFNSLLKATILSVSLAIVLPVPVLVAQTGTNNPVNPPVNTLILPTPPSPNGFPTYQINPNPNVSPDSVNNPTPPSPNGFPTYQINPNNPNPNVSPDSVNNPKPPSPNGFPTYQINPNNPNINVSPDNLPNPTNGGSKP